MEVQKTRHKKMRQELPRYSLCEFFAGCAILFVAIGFVIEIDLRAYGLSQGICEEWDGAFWKPMIFEWSFSPRFVTRYVVFGLNALPGWIVLSFICLLLGLFCDRLADGLALAIVISVPLAALLFDCLTSLGHALYLNLRLVSACGSIACAGAWYLGRAIGGRGKSHKRCICSPRTRRLAAIVVTGIVFAFGLNAWRVFPHYWKE